MAEATEAYYLALKDNPVAVEYLSKSRGLTGISAQSFKLGVVTNPLPGHERYAGWLSIPYLTLTGPIGVRFRRLDDGEPKYLSVTGWHPLVFNVEALRRPEPYVCICEGEFDAMTATQAGLPAVGIAGVSAWRPFFARCFKGYDTVYVLADADDKGQGVTFAEKLAGELDNVRIVPMPDGHDVNSFVLECGADALRERLEITSS